uniref:PurM-like C-terminal domain-containing protein n=1 Tax=Glossina brevipalpis TaxID=37001 RepID=A0A1A9WJ33_9MUSC
MDCSVVQCQRRKEFFLVQTVDFFYPLVDDPKLMGKIALANVVSDVYAIGATEIDKLNMIISAPTELSAEERDIVLPMIIDGFRESAQMADCRVNIQNIALNPWCIIGGIATSLCKQPEIILPYNAKDGDHLVLTKPLGIQLATNAHIWLNDKNENYYKLAEHFSDEIISNTFKMAIKSMIFLNRDAAKLMHKYEAHAATDITGFGLMGHAGNLAEFQTERLQFVITKLPILKNVLKFGEILSLDMKLRNGKSVETSGGLLIALPAKHSKAFCQEFNLITKGEQYSWTVGYVKHANKREAILAQEPEYIDVEL